MATSFYPPNAQGIADIRVQAHCLNGVDLEGTIDAGIGMLARWTGDPRYLLTYRATFQPGGDVAVWMVDLESGESAPFPLPPEWDPQGVGDPLPSWRPRP